MLGLEGVGVGDGAVVAEVDGAVGQEGEQEEEREEEGRGNRGHCLVGINI